MLLEILKTYVIRVKEVWTQGIQHIFQAYVMITFRYEKSSALLICEIFSTNFF